MKKLSRVFVAALSFFILLSPSFLLAEKQPAVHLTILHVNDTHGHILPSTGKSPGGNTMVGGAAYMARMIQDERSKNPDGTLLLSAGDMFQGTPISNIFRGEPVIEVMNFLKFDAMAVGNHEFDWGSPVFNRMLSSAGFPFLSANIKDEKDHYLPGVRPYVIVARKNLNIAVIGLTTPEVLYVSKLDPSVKINVQSPEIILPALIKKVKDEGAHMVIVLSHLGVHKDIELAKRVTGIHVIVGGHSHTALERPVTAGDAIVVQAGCYGLYLGVLELEIESGTDPMTYRIKRGTLEKVLAGPDQAYDKTTALLVDKYHDQIKDEFARVIGETAVDLERNDQGESNIGDLICDVMREAAGTDIAFFNSKGIRTNIPRGRITLEQVYTLLPFDNSLVTMDLTGSQILELLEHSAGHERGILQVSGMKVQYDLSEPAGTTVKEVYIGHKPLDRERTYTVATNDFLATGGDAFSTFKAGKNITYGKDLREVFMSYLKKHSPVQPRTEKRIIIHKSSLLPPFSLSIQTPGFFMGDYFKLPAETLDMTAFFGTSSAARSRSFLN